MSEDRGTWDGRELGRRKHAFLAERRAAHPMVLSTSLIFAVTWLAGWCLSAGLLRAGLVSMPVRYGLAFALSYGVFFACVRVWATFVPRDRDGNVGNGFDVLSAGYGEGCLIVIGVWLASFLVVGLFWVSGGFAALLEAAFEVAFAGTLVRRLGRAEMVGQWARALLAGTWPHALVALLILMAIAAALQSRVPEAHTFAQAITALRR